MLPFEIFDVNFPYLTNGGLFEAKILAERRLTEIYYRIYPLNRIDFNTFELIYDNEGHWTSSSDYVKQKEFFSSICSALEDHLNNDPLVEEQMF